jgi:hypothetical protein
MTRGRSRCFLHVMTVARLPPPHLLAPVEPRPWFDRHGQTCRHHEPCSRQFAYCGATRFVQVAGATLYPKGIRGVLCSRADEQKTVHTFRVCFRRDDYSSGESSFLVAHADTLSLYVLLLPPDPSRLVLSPIRLRFLSSILPLIRPALIFPRLHAPPHLKT